MERSYRSTFLTLTGLILLIIVLSLGYFSRQSLRLDESQSLWQTSHSPAKIMNIIAQDVHVPLYHTILHYWQLFLGNGVATGRMLSLIFFIISIPALYFLGKRAFSSSVGLFAATLLTVSPFMNWYGNEIRMYSLMVFVTIMSQYFFIGIYKYQDNDSWLGYFLTGLCGIYVHYFFWFVLLVQAIFFFVFRDMFQKGSFKRFVLIAGIYVLAFIPWIWYVKHLSTLSNEAPKLTPPNSVNVFNTFSQFLFGFQNDHLNTLLVSLWPITVLLGFWALRENKRVNQTVLYFLLSVLVPITIAFVVSVFIIPMFVSRYLILTIPALYLFIGWVFSTYPPRLERVLRYTLLAVMVIGLVVEMLNPAAPVKEDYRDAVSYIQNHATPQDAIVVSAPFTVYPVEYYYQGLTDIVTIPNWNRFVTGPIPAFDKNKLPTEVDAIVSDHQNAYVLLSYDQGYEKSVKDYFDTHFQRIDVEHFSPDLNLYVYKLRYDPPVLQTAMNKR